MFIIRGEEPDKSTPPREGICKSWDVWGKRPKPYENMVIVQLQGKLDSIARRLRIE